MAAEFSALDQQKFNRFHLKTILVSGIGFFTDALDIFAINLAIPIIEQVWYPVGALYPKGMPAVTSGLLKASTQVGTLFGQLLFGHLSDKLGRKSMYGLVLAVMIMSTLNTTLAADTKGLLGIGAILIFWRFVLGIGIGGDYPISAVITSEFASISTRGLMIAAVFAMQGLGILVGSLCCIIILASMKSQLTYYDPILNERSLYNPYDNVWRILLFLGVIPALMAVYWRLKLPESPRFTAQQGDIEVALKDQAMCVAQAKPETAPTSAPNCEGYSSSSANEIEYPRPEDIPVTLQDKYSHLTFKQVFWNWKNGKILFATAMTWFLLDVGFYGVQMNQSLMLESIGFAKSKSGFDKFYELAIGNLILSFAGTVPGYWVTVFTIEKLGRIRIQLLGFTALSIIFIALTASWHELVPIPINKNMPVQVTFNNKIILMVLFSLANFFFNFGPNATTFIIPAELFPTKFRSTCHGISAAVGKLGAIIAAFGFKFLSDEVGFQCVLGIFSACMLGGLVLTFLIPETKGKTLEELGDSFYSPEIIKAAETQSSEPSKRIETPSTSTEEPKKKKPSYEI